MTIKRDTSFRMADPIKNAVTERFLDALKASYQAYVERGARSTAKLIPLHGWLRDEIASNLGSEYEVAGMGVGSKSEHRVDGMYYKKPS